MALSAADYAVMLTGLLPRGPAWNDQVVAHFCAAWSEEFARVDARVDALIEEVDPRTAIEMLSDWERLLGLPDDCTMNLELSTSDRQRLAWAKLTEQGGQSRAYFIALGERYGEPGLTISEFGQMTCNSNVDAALYSQADEFVWRVNVPRAALNARPMNCNDDCDDALQLYQASFAECPIRERKPAQTNVIFAYS